MKCKNFPRSRSSFSPFSGVTVQYWFLDGGEPPKIFGNLTTAHIFRNGKQPPTIENLLVSYTYQNDYDNKIPNLPKWSIKYRDFPIISTRLSHHFYKQNGPFWGEYGGTPTDRDETPIWKTLCGAWGPEATMNTKVPKRKIEKLEDNVISYKDVSENRATPKSSILIGFSIINHPFWDTTIFGNTYKLGAGNSHRIFLWR